MKFVLEATRLQERDCQRNVLRRERERVSERVRVREQRKENQEITSRKQLTSRIIYTGHKTNYTDYYRTLSAILDDRVR